MYVCVCLIWFYIFEILRVVFYCCVGGTWVVFIVCYFPVRMENFGVSCYCTIMRIMKVVIDQSPIQVYMQVAIHGTR